MEKSNFNKQYKNFTGLSPATITALTRLGNNQGTGAGGPTNVPPSGLNSTGSGPTESNSNGTGNNKPFWETGFGQFLLDFSGTNPNNNTTGPHPNNNQNNNNNTNTNNTCLPPNTMISGVCMQPPKKKSYLGWYIAGGVAGAGLLTLGVVLVVKASKKKQVNTK